MRAPGIGVALAVCALGACSGEQLRGGDVRATDGVGALPPFDAGTMPAVGDACWTGALPAEPLPILPQSTVASACAIGTAATAWSYPQDPAGTDADDRRLVVGRWATCGAMVVTPVAGAGIEFGANGRWRVLTTDATGALAPVSSTETGASGYYYLLGTGQLDLRGESPVSGGQTFLVSFAPGMDAIRFDSQSGATPAIYARTTPSPLNGDDDPPPTTDGICSLVGDWDLPANMNPPGAPAATFSFDSAGNFVAEPAGVNVCAEHPMFGTYALSPGWFQLTTNVGLGLCPWSDWAAYPAVFDATCSQLTLMQEYDNCTGGRGYFNQTTTLTRRSGGSPAVDAGTVGP